MLLRALILLCLLASPAFAQSLNILTLEAGYVSGTAMGGYGTYTGSAPTSATGTWTNCGGGTATITNFITGVYPAYGASTFLVTANPPPSDGTNCTLHITTNLSTTASSPPTVVTASNSAPVTFNIHNAPGWLTSHSYTPASGPKTRVVNGAGWTPGTSTWNPGSALNAYELTSSSCTSASSGGPTGTGSSISDGTCTWKYLSGVDYVTATGFLNDAPVWSSGTTYTFGNYVTTNVSGHLRAYQLDSNNSSPIALSTSFCTSTVQPSGTGSGSGGIWSSPQLTVGGDGCIWDYMADIIYSSQVDPIPHETFANATGGPGGDSGFVPHLTHNYDGAIWNDTEYLSGSGNEAPFIVSRDHNAGHQFEENPPGVVCPPDYCANIQIAPAPGEGFSNSYTTSTPISGYDATKGVAFRNTSTAGGSGNEGSNGFLAWDWGMTISGIQAQSLHSMAIMGFNFDTFVGNLLDGGGDPAYGFAASALYGDVGTIAVNNLIFTHGPQGVSFKYNAGYMLYNTIVNVGSYSGPVCINSGNDTYGALFLSNNTCMGYSSGHFFAILTGSGFTIGAGSGHNITDAPIGDSGLTWWFVNGGTSTSATVQTVPNSTYGSTASAAFVNPATDFRPSTALIGAAAAFGSFNYCNPGVPSPCTHNYDTPDMIGTTRPAPGYDAGALEHGASAPPTSIGLRRWFNH